MIRSRFLRVIAIFGLVLTSIFTGRVPSAQAETYVDGDTISANQTIDGTWGPGTITLDGDIVINSGVVISILPNTVIKVTDGGSLTVNGTLNIDGPVTFTSASGSPTPGIWDGITYSPGSNGYIDDITIEYAVHALTLDTINPIPVSNSTLRYNRHSPPANQLAFGAGLTIRQGNHLISNTLIHHNEIIASGSGQVRGGCIHRRWSAPHYQFPDL